MKGLLGQFVTQRSISSDVLQKISGAPERIRTSDPLIRSQVLYPAELRVRRWPGFKLMWRGAQEKKYTFLHLR